MRANKDLASRATARAWAMKVAVYISIGWLAWVIGYYGGAILRLIQS